MKMMNMTPELYQYVSDHQLQLHPVLPDLIAETRRRSDSNMQISPEQGVFMHTLARLIGAQRIVEVGCFTGYSSICLGLALGEGGELISCDINPETAEVARRYQDLAGLGGKSRVELGAAALTLDHLIKKYGAATFDLAFIDADKENYALYYEKCLQLVRKNGVILVDNVLWSGHVLNDADQSPSTVAIRTFNEMVRKDPRVDASLLPIADGLYVLRKR